jgi:hypothetical protein
VVVILLGLIIILAAFAVTAWQRQRRAQSGGQVPRGFQRTDEVVIDPTTGARQRVWYNPRTGERLYLPDSDS